MNKYKEIGEVVRAMDTLVRCVNNETYINGWLMCGVADGDAEEMTDEELGENYAYDLTDMMDLFLRIMAKAKKDGGLYVAGFTSTEG